MAKEKTLSDFNLEVSKTKQSYLKSKMDFNWNYTFKEENHENFVYFMIANKHQATKLLFDVESQTIIKKDMYTTDVTTMKELQDQL